MSKIKCNNSYFDDMLMVTAAHRYCLGRSTYIISSCITWLKSHYDSFDQNTKSTIVRDTFNAIQTKAAGMYMDYVEWYNFLEWCLRKDDTEYKNHNGHVIILPEMVSEKDYNKLSPYPNRSQ